MARRPDPRAARGAKPYFADVNRNVLDASSSCVHLNARWTQRWTQSGADLRKKQRKFLCELHCAPWSSAHDKTNLHRVEYIRWHEGMSSLPSVPAVLFCCLGRHSFWLRTALCDGAWSTVLRCVASSRATLRRACVTVTVFFRRIVTVTRFCDGVTVVS